VDAAEVAVRHALRVDRNWKRQSGEVASKHQRFSEALHKPWGRVGGLERQLEVERALRGVGNGIRLGEPIHRGKRLVRDDAIRAERQRLAERRRGRRLRGRMQLQSEQAQERDCEHCAESDSRSRRERTVRRIR